MPVRHGGSYLKKSPDAEAELIERTADAPHSATPAPARIERAAAAEETSTDQSKSGSSKSTPKSRAKE